MKVVRGGVGGEITLYDLRAKQIERLRRVLSFPNPEYVRALRMNRHVSNVEERIYSVREHQDGSISVPRGAVREVRQTLAKDNIKVEFYDHRSRGTPLVMDEFVGELRDYQDDGVSAIKRNVQGLILLPCGSGKTTIGVAAVKRVARSTLVIAHTDDLIDQWVGSFRDRLHYDPGQIRSRVRDIRPITVASVWMLDQENDLRGLMDSSEFGFVIVDECHHAPAATFTRVLRQLPAYHRLGLTATRRREDGQTKLVDWSFGEIVCERDVPELVRAGWLTAPEVRVVETAFDFEWTGLKIKQPEALARALVANAERNEQIVKLAHREVERGECVLVLANRKALCEKLGRMLKARGIEAPVLTSRTSHKIRKEMIDQMRLGGRNILIATSLADEGLDVPRLSRILLVMPERARGRTIQRVGRLMRPYKGKNPILFDFVDRKVELLRNRWDERRRAFKQIGLIIVEAP